jgi:hypothetical protein
MIFLSLNQMELLKNNKYKLGNSTMGKILDESKLDIVEKIS